MKKKWILAILAVAVMGLAGCSGKDSTDAGGKDGESVQSDNAMIQDLLDRDLTNDYPQDPYDVVDYYCSVTKQIHSRNITDKEVEGLCKKMRELFDEELLANNKYEDHVQSLKQEVSSYKSNNTVISSYRIQDADSITILEDSEGIPCTTVDIEYSLKSNTIQTSSERVLLRKDSGDNWRIYGWGSVSGSAK